MMFSQTWYDIDLRAFTGCIPRLMGTRLEALLCDVSPDVASDVWSRFCTRSQELHNCLDRFSPNSDVSRWNRGELAEASGDLLTLMLASDQWRTLTGGLFDIAYGMSGDSGSGEVGGMAGACEMPAEGIIGPGSGISRGGSIDFGGKELGVHSPRCGSIDFGGIAKGWLLEEFKTMLLSSGLRCAYVNFGTSTILTLGRHPSGGPWSVSLPNPFPTDSGSKQDSFGTLDRACTLDSFHTLDSFSLQDCALSISGNTPLYDGHIIDPRTSMPVSGRKLTSVQGPSPLSVEVLSTAAMVASETELEQLREAFPDYTFRVY